MCGIMGKFETDKVSKKDGKTEHIAAGSANGWLVNTFEDQHSRGMEGFGLIRISPEGKVEIDRACEPAKFMIDLYRKESSMMIAHHRKPTSTPNKMSQTHPMMINCGDLAFNYAIVHNGVVSNDNELKKEHEGLGYVYQTDMTESSPATGYRTVGKFNDSESFAIEVARYIEKKTTVMGARGSCAFIAVQMTKEGKAVQVFFGRSEGVLKMSQTRNKLCVSSEGEGQEIPDATMYSFNLKDPNMKLDKREFVVAKWSSRAPVTTHQHNFRGEDDTVVADIVGTDRTIVAKTDVPNEDEPSGVEGWDDELDQKEATKLAQEFANRIKDIANPEDIMDKYEEEADTINDMVFEHLTNFHDSIDPDSNYNYRETADECLMSVRHLLIAMEKIAAIAKAEREFKLNMGGRKMDDKALAEIDKADPYADLDEVRNEITGQRLDLID